MDDGIKTKSSGPVFPRRSGQSSHIFNFIYFINGKAWLAPYLSPAGSGGDWQAMASKEMDTVSEP